MGRYIYILCEPDTGRPRYVGVAVDPERRLRAHVARARHERTHKGAWLRALRARRVKPELCVLQAIGTDESWQEAERLWIVILRAQGWDLTNGTDGGEGMEAGTPPPNKGQKAPQALRDKLSAACVAYYADNPDAREALAERGRAAARANIGRPVHDDVFKQALADRNRASAGVPRGPNKQPFSDETRRRMSEAAKARCSTPEGKRIMSQRARKKRDQALDPVRSALLPLDDE